MIKIHKQKKSGFTIIELIMVVLIISLLTMGVITSINRQRSYLEYDQAITNINSLIKEARNFALSSRPVYDQSMPEGQESYIPQRGYGVYIERSDNLGESQVILFANTSDNEERANQYDDGDIVEQVMTLSSDVTFQTMEAIDLESPPIVTPINRAVVLFQTPQAETFIAENDDPSNPIVTMPHDTLEMRFFRTSAGVGFGQRTISINRTAGFPEIELN